MRNALHWAAWTLAGTLMMWPIAELFRMPQLVAAILGGAGALAGMLAAGELIGRRELRAYERELRG